MSERTSDPTVRRRTVAKAVVVLGSIAILVNVIMLANEGGSSTPQIVNIVLGAVLLVVGAGRLRSLRS